MLHIEGINKIIGECPNKQCRITEVKTTDTEYIFECVKKVAIYNPIDFTPTIREGEYTIKLSRIPSSDDQSYSLQKFNVYGHPVSLLSTVNKSDLLNMEFLKNKITLILTVSFG